MKYTVYRIEIFSIIKWCTVRVHILWYFTICTLFGLTLNECSGYLKNSGYKTLKLRYSVVTKLTPIFQERFSDHMSLEISKRLTPHEQLLSFVSVKDFGIFITARIGASEADSSTRRRGTPRCITRWLRIVVPESPKQCEARSGRLYYYSHTRTRICSFYC